VTHQQLKYREPMTGPAIESIIARLAREASIEINAHDLEDIEASREVLGPGRKVFVSFLPKQSWEATLTACRNLTRAGFAPVPHIPVRLLPDARALDRLFGRLVSEARVGEVLLLSGDYAQGVGQFSRVEDVLATGVLVKHGLARVSFAGHPEGHPKVTVEEIRRAERAKVLAASASGLEASLVTQFFFEVDPFLAWEQELRSAGLRGRFVAGLAGPARITTLFKFALRCGAGPSIRALGARPGAWTQLMGDHGPQQVMRDLAEAHSTGASAFAGIHLFCFGGYLRTCAWLNRISKGEFSMNKSGGFDLD
jgi:methylenetetrahydrofolate reductase (NADPH)